MTPKKIIIGLATTATVMGGVDANVLNEQPISRVEMVANERVEAKQVGNVIETTFPWKDQPGIKIKVDLGEPTLAERLKDERKKEVITETVTDFEGGFKVDILLNEKPDTNVFCYNIEGKENYDFFYQPPLTEQEIADGASRPPEIEGSYAVYHKTLRNHIVGKENYATGKVMHIPRPQVWSMSDVDTKVWADMTYTDSEGLCVTVPQDFLDKAEYPVRVDPTFGYTTLGASSDNTQLMHGSAFGVLDRFRLESITYGSQFSGTTERASALYASTSPATYINNSGTERATSGSDSRAFYTLNSTTTPILNPGEYFIVVKSNTTSFFRPYDTVSGTAYMNESTGSYAGWDATEAGINYGNSYSAYATYSIISTTTPTVVTASTTNIFINAVTLNGSTTADGYADVTSRGFTWGTEPTLVGGDTQVTTVGSGTSTIGAFSAFITGLVPQTTYYVQAFATNASGTATGTIQAFNTEDSPPFSETFETSTTTTSKFDSDGSYGTGAFTLDSTSKVNGIDSARCNISTAGDGCVLTETLSYYPQNVEYYAQFTILLPTGFAIGGSGYLSLFSFGDGVGNPVYCNLEDYGTIRLICDGDELAYTDTGIDIPLNTPTTLEFRVKVGATTGDLDIWKNEGDIANPTYNGSGTLNTGTQNITSFSIGGYHPDIVNDKYYDDVYISTGFIGTDEIFPTSRIEGSLIIKGSVIIK